MGYVLDLCSKQCWVQRCFCYCRVKSFFASQPTSPHHWAGWGCTRSWEGTHQGQLAPADQREIPDHMASCSAHKKWRKKKEGRKVHCDVICLLKSPLGVMECCFLVRLNTCPPMESVEWILSFAFPAHAACALPVKLSVSSHKFFSFLLFWSSPPFQCEGSEWAFMWGLIAGRD